MFGLEVHLPEVWLTWCQLDYVMFILWFLFLCVAPPAGAAAAVCSAAGDQSSTGRTAGGRAGTLLHTKGAGEGQSSVASENHGCGSSGWRYDVQFCICLLITLFFVVFICLFESVCIFLFLTMCNCTVFLCACVHVCLIMCDYTYLFLCLFCIHVYLLTVIWKLPV